MSRIYKNKFRFAGKNFDKFISQGDNYDQKDGYKPSNLGKHSKVVRGMQVNVRDGNNQEADFARNMYGECGRIEDFENFRKQQ